MQRVSSARVIVDGKTVGEIGGGLLALVGAAKGDSEEDVKMVAEKTINLRIFEDDAGKMNLSLLDTGGELLVVSQFTLLADCTKGRRPSFFDAMDPEPAAELVERFATCVERRGLRVGRGVFGASMTVELVNDGPVTIVLDSADRRKK